MPIPALIITYSRVDGLERLVNSCIEAGATRIYVAIDGPRDSKTTEIQKAMHEVLDKFKNLDQEKIKVWQRETNLGIAVSVITAIDWFFKYETSGLILEDDLVVSQEFFNYAERTLKYFENDNQIQLLSGNRYDSTSGAFPVQVSYPQTWGWATWREKWKSIRESVSVEPTLKISHSNRAVKNFWQIGAERVWAGYIDTWDLLVARSLLLDKKTCLLPPANLVSNAGIDDFSTHTTQDLFPIGFPIQDLSAEEIDLEKVEGVTNSKANQFLEKRVFGINWRHYFLHLYAPLIELHFKRKYESGSLSLRLGRISIP